MQTQLCFIFKSNSSMGKHKGLFGSFLSLKFCLIAWIVFTIDFQCSGYTIDYKTLKEDHGLVEPFQLPGTSLKVAELENMEGCDCPRVYFPACAEDGKTYVNACVLKCSNTKLVRLGPCVNYRRLNILTHRLDFPTNRTSIMVTTNNLKYRMKKTNL